MPLQSEIVMTPSRFQKINKSLDISPSYYVGALGMPCQTAYGALFCDDKLQMKPQGTILVSGAAGMVGSAVGQLARLRGASRVIGIAGGQDKCDIAVKKFGFDVCLDYKKFNGDSLALQAALKEAAPEGIDFYFDNVGGFISAAVWSLLNEDACVGVCGQIAHYNDKAPVKIDAFLSKIIYPSVTIKGISYAKYAQQPSFFEKFFQTLIPTLLGGTFQVEETTLKGIEQLPTAFVGLFKGNNTGKMVVTF